MKIQSLSVVVPNKRCMNNCKFGVCNMHPNDEYKNQMNDNLPFFDLYLRDYIQRLEFARDNGCNTVMLTGNSEPQQNRKFLTYFGMMMERMQNPFRWIEMQTTGAGIDANYLRFLRNHVGVKFISLSVSSFDDEKNKAIITMPKNIEFNLKELCDEIKRYDFSLRLSLNMTSCFDEYVYEPEKLFKICKETYGADQVTLRQLYASGLGTDQDEWVEQYGLVRKDVLKIHEYVKENGRVLGVLPHGLIKYSLHGLCVVSDFDCMDTEEKTNEDYKYLILQPNCKLYSRWDDPASLIF